jgi:hypothetical protein
MAYSGRRGGRIGEIVVGSKSIQDAWRRFTEGGETEKEDSGLEAESKLARNIGGKANE